MTALTVAKYIGIAQSEVQEKKHNIWVGISISNKKFTPKNIEALIRFALEHTKEKVLVWVPGRMQATNYYYFDNLRRSEALKKSFEDEDRFKEIVRDIIYSLPEGERNKVSVAGYDDICTPRHIMQREVFFRAFADQGTFYDAVMEIAEEIMIIRGRTPDKKRAEAIAVYVLHELPLFVDGVQTIYQEEVYTLFPYPGSGKIDQLEMDIVGGMKFPEITQRLKLQNKVGILDVEFV
jgi:tRNA-dependent cyclodipeptide synthase